VEELERLFGEDTIIVEDPKPFGDVKDILRRFKKGGFDEMVVVAPLSVIAKLTECGIQPLYAQMEAVSPNDGYDTIANGRYYRFVEFKRIKAIKIEFTEV